eukprot:SAG11_NODE_37306_length_257_cov_0.987342_1_plen_40_part_01
MRLMLLPLSPLLFLLLRVQSAQQLTATAGDDIAKVVLLNL